MDKEHSGLLKIGAFSVLSHISVRMLRYYQDHGILEPTYVDPFSGHRFYQSQQLNHARLVTSLRDAGCPIERIAKILDSIDSPATLQRLLSAQRDELTRRRNDIHTQLAMLDHVTCMLQGEATMTEVNRKFLPPMITASLRRIIPSYHHEGTLWEELMPLVQQAHLAFPADGISGATFHDPEYREADVDVEVWMQVTEQFAEQEPLICTVVPQQEVVSAVLRGDYSQMPAATEAIGVYLAEHGLTTGPMFNIYHVSPAQNPDPSSWVTEICFPIINNQ